MVMSDLKFHYFFLFNDLSNLASIKKMNSFQQKFIFLKKVLKDFLSIVILNQENV